MRLARGARSAREVHARARDLLRRCCIQGNGAACDGCDPSTPLVLGTLEHPGNLTPVGPLAPDVVERIGRVAGRSLHLHNRVRPLLDGTSTYGAMLDLVEQADHEILFENFIFSADAVGTAFADELKVRAGEGVDVRVLHDPLGSLMSRHGPIGLRFHGSSAQVRVHNPPRPTAAFLKAGRDHRKLVVQDRWRAVAGGLCLADAWVGHCVQRCTWRDSAVLVEGEAAADAAEAFDELWRRGLPFTPGGRVAEPPRPPASVVPLSEPTGSVPVRVIADEPRQRRVERVLQEVLAAARHEVLITNPYVLPTENVIREMVGAARRGVAVHLIVPLHGNHSLAELASEHGWGVLLRAGVRIWRWTGPMIHAKTFVVDRAWTLIGSSNLDSLSLTRNAELNFEIHGSAVGRSMAGAFLRDRNRSVAVRLDEWATRPRRRRVAARMAAGLQAWL